MPRHSDLPPEDFDRLLKWLDAPADLPGARYQQVHRRLVKYFAFKGCDTPEDLADEVMDRVARFLRKEISVEHPEDQFRVFFGFAKNIYSEYLRARQQMSALPANLNQNVSDTGYIEKEHECLDSCMQRLPEPERNLLVHYYAYPPKAKIEHRKEIAAHMGLAQNALRIRMCRLRSRVTDCVMRCLDLGRMPQVQ